MSRLGQNWGNGDGCKVEAGPKSYLNVPNHTLIYKIIPAIRVGHANAEYAEYADYAHMRNMRMRMRIENLIYIFHIKREKMSLFKRQWNQKSNDEKCVKYAFLSPFTIK